MSTQTAGFLLVAAAACLWGTLGLAGRHLYAAGMTPGIAVTLRAGGAALVLLLGLGIFRPSALRVTVRDLPYFAAYGLVSVASFYLLYFWTIQQIPVASAAILLYTAPVFVAVAAYLLLGESFTRRKLVALLVVLAGCALVVRAYEPGALQVQGPGLLTGLGSGFTYGMYSIFGKYGLRKYSAWTLQAYSLVFGSLALGAVYGRAAVDALVQSPGVWPWVAYLVLVTTVGAYGLYLAGLERVESGLASIVATVEPVVAALLAFFLLGEPLEWLQVGGIGLVLAGVAWLQGRQRGAAAAVKSPAGQPPG